MIRILQLVSIISLLSINLLGQTINGPDSVCAFSNNINYSIAVNPMATSYMWELPSGATVTGPNNNNSINIDFDGVSDSICVTPNLNGTPGTRVCKLIFVDILNASINGDTIICGSQIAGVNAIANGGVPPFTYLWSNSNTNQGQFIAPFVDQTFSVTITDAIGCVDNASHFINVTPSVTITASDDENIIPGSSTTISASGDSNYIWAPAASLSCSLCQSPIAFPAQTTTYFVTSTSANECTKGDSVTISVEIFDNILIPTIFTPNGDGINDLWKAQGVDIASIRIIIFNRWGEEVYNSIDINEGWNGLYENDIAMVGVYTYFIEYSIFGLNYNIIKSGDITLIR